MAGGRTLEGLVALALMPASAIPESARAMARFSLFDWLTVARAGSGEPVARIVRELVEDEGGRPVAAVAGSGTRVPPRAAALANGTISHALDYDDTHFAHVGHLSVGVYPAALAIGEQRDAFADAVVDAFLVGAEAAVRLGVSLGRGHYERGFHQTATAGAFGATVAAGRLLGLSPDQLRNALSLVATRSSGLKSQFGTMGKPFNAGIAASNGVEAASLAALGFVSCDDGIGGAQGFADTHSDATNEELAWADPPPGRFQFEDIKYKLHACCHGTHAMLEAIRTVKAADPSLPGDVERLVLRTNPRWLRVCDVREPRTGLEAKFSYRLLAAMALAGVDTAADSTFTDALCADPALVSVARRVEVVGDADLGDMQADLLIERRGGAATRATHDISVPLSHEALERGLRTKAEGLLGAEAATRLWQAAMETGSLRARDLGRLLGEPG
jgi:2-methylcitrate dehydratase PrpD